MKIFIIFFSLSSLLFAEMIQFPKPKTYEEALFIRRITAFWEDGEKETAIRQIEAYLTENPEGILSDTLRIHLGVFYLEKEEQETALTHFSAIQDEELIKKSLFKKIECLFALNRFEQMIEEGEVALDYFPENASEHYQLLSILGNGYAQLAQKAENGSKKQIEFALQGKSYLLMLETTKLFDDILPILAYFHQVLGEPEAAAKIYTKLADKSDGNREDLLFQAAQVQMEFDKGLAAQTFGQICHLGGKKASDAAFNRLLALFELERYRDILLIKDQLFSLIEKEKQGFVHFVIGKSYFNLEEYQRAYPELKAALELSRTKDHKTFENVCATLLDCAQKLGDLDGFNQYLEELFATNPDHGHNINAKMAQAMLYKSKKDYNKAIEVLEDLFQSHPDMKENSLALFEYAHLHFLNKNWEEAAKWFNIYHNQEKSDPIAFHFYLQATVNAAKTDANPQTLQSLIERLEQALHEDIYSQDSKLEYQYALAKAFYDLGEYKEAIGEAEALLLQENLPKALRQNAMFLIAYSFEQAGEISQFCQYGEKLAELSPNHPNIAALHVHLFNAYLDRDRMESASEHLFTAFAKGKEISQANKRWLADYYFSSVEKYVSKYPNNFIKNDPSTALNATRATSLWESLFRKSPSFTDSDNQSLEEDALNLASLYEWQHQFRQMTTLMENLAKAYKDHPQVEWQHQKQTEFFIAKGYLLSGEEERAVPKLEQLCQEERFVDYSQAFSGLHLARIYARHVKGSKDQSKKDKALSLLVHLTLNRNFLNEPIHLEAAFDYVNMISKFNTDKETASKRLELLAKQKSQFLKTDDIPSKDYHQMKEEHPEKSTLFSAYLDLFDLEMIMCELCIAVEEGNNEKALDLSHQAKKIISLWSDVPVHRDFNKRLEEGKQRWSQLSSITAQLEQEE
jgi:tetratricopeptide (TPR) repeat protein